MKKFLAIAAAAAAVVSLTGVAHAGSADATASVQVVQPVSVFPITNLSFGTVAPPSSGSGGHVTIDPTDGSSAGNGVQLLQPTARGRFQVVAGDQFGYNIAVSSTVTLNGPGGQLTANLNLSNNSAIGNGNGQDVFVGGDLFVPAGTYAGGVYSGTFSLSADYQ